MIAQKLKVLLIIEQCNPEWSSVPWVGYCFYKSISQLVDATLVTHARNQTALEKVHPERDIFYVEESDFIKQYYKVAEKASKIGKKIIWPLYNTLIYPVYGEFNHLVYSRFKNTVHAGDFDVVHAITPMMPRYPVKLVEACVEVPFLLGPVNGGVPFPKGFQKIARQEFSYLNFLRLIGRLIIPGYRSTYEKANQILAGSTYTLGMIKELFPARKDCDLQLFYENGVDASFLKQVDGFDPPSSSTDGPAKLLFVGRLVPYKGADILIDAISQLSADCKVQLNIVGDGSEREALESQVRRLNLSDRVRFTGWVPQENTLEYYREADVFCFPSVREFGGAVVLEALASGLPCIVVENGGIGEYVTDATGFKIPPRSREFVVQELTRHITKLVQDVSLRQSMGRNAIQRAKEFTWENKAEKIVDIYKKVLSA